MKAMTKGSSKCYSEAAFIEQTGGVHQVQTKVIDEYCLLQIIAMGKKITLEVETSDDINDVIIETLPNTSIRIVKVKILENSNASSGHSSPSGSTLHLGICLKVSMQIFVETVIGERFTFQVESSDTISSLMGKIKEREGFPMKHQRLVFRGKELEKELTLAHYGIENGSALQLVLQIGAPAPSNTISSSSKRNRSEEM